MAKTLPATRDNMRRVYRPGVFAFSPITLERSSADPGDYFWLPPAVPLLDSQGQPMVLAREQLRILAVTK